MKYNPKPFKHTNGNKDIHDSAKPKSLPQLLPRPSIEESPTTANPMMTSSNDLVPSSGPNRSRIPPTVSTPLPPLPAGWEGTEDMKVWLLAKIEEDRRKQQEEKTQQANVVLEQRRIEQSMLSDALRARVPPNLVPLIFNGIYTTNTQYSTPASRSATPPTVPQQQDNQCSAPPTGLPTAPQPSQQSPKRPHEKASRSSQAATELSETRQSRWSEAIANQHRERMISSEREQLRRKLKSQNIQFADKELLDTAFEHTFPVTRAMIQDLPPRSLADSPDTDAGSQGVPPKPSQESGQRKFRSQPQQQLQVAGSPASISSATSHLHQEQTNTASPKRKNPRSHKKAPPPQCRRNETVSGQKNPLDKSQLDHKRQQRDLSSSNESRTCEGDSSEQLPEQEIQSTASEKP
ncbi:uncharacterized protein PGRI_037030 [Penicillium griseofulvum]|uniref:Uncharacterized protein n=1 Tax=Penicillium patulum TaxID=5078 RepID=A0A135LDC3_PENPA|nr:uncharacterized protein PGRI_037030 [Penicillium griseofulvum]KXG46957.1 hypothetical protein PGRI_037030 [Penicillium griseofulvum]